MRKVCGLFRLLAGDLCHSTSTSHLTRIRFFDVFYLGTFCSFILLLSDGNVEPLHLMRNKSPHIFGPHLWLGRFQRDITCTDPSLSIVSLQSEYHL